MIVPVFSEEQVLEKIMTKKNPFFDDYYAFYSSWLGGIVKNPHLMLVPIDDHMVHRGDGVFEAMKSIKRSVYQMDQHLKRLFISADKIGIKSPFDYNQMKDLILQTLRTANQNETIIRLFLSRGPGNFSVNPYDSLEPQFYIVITRLIPPLPAKYTNGVVIGKSTVPVKTGWMAQVKSCNYLPNVLMKKEAVDRKLDFVVGVDEEGRITESATENLIIVDPAGVIVHPNLDFILKGTTMIRACELARENGIHTEARDITVADLHSATEMMITGTSLNVLPVVKFENHIIGNGKPGPIAKNLNNWMLKDIALGLQGTPY